jgi:ketosteroid isomerase-like protein
MFWPSLGQVLCSLRGNKDASGKEMYETGKFCETWKKQADGSWKCIVDIWNADPAKQ